MLRKRVQEELVKAMKAQEKERLEALRFLWSLIKNAEIDEKGELSDDQVIKIVGSEVKKRREAIEQIRKGGREELAKDEEEKLKVISEFAPEQMSEKEIEREVEQIVSELGSPPAGGFGKIMGMVMKKLGGKADGKLVAEIVRKKLTKV